ncbi:MAG: alpha/beta fold hydrolase [Candidatus Pacearchaeota archaeon]
MVKYKVNKRAKEINLVSNSKRIVFLIHGYTGSPTDFNKLPFLLHKKLKSNVKVVLLKGHGTNVSDLNNFKSFEDYRNQVEDEFLKIYNKKRDIVVGGYSFGGQLALYLASKYKVKGVFSISAPYPLSFFLTSKPLALLCMIKKEWKKPLPKKEIKMRKNAFYYMHMPGHTLHILRHGYKTLKKVLPNVKAPLLLINSKEDIWIPSRSAHLLSKKAGSVKKEIHIIDHKGHNLFYSNKKKEIYSKIINFLSSVYNESK